MAIGSQIDVLSLFGRFSREQGVSLRDPRAGELFLDSVRTSVEDALQNDALQHGQRTQNMFEALIVSLGEYKLLKTEDTGVVHPKGLYTAPDFRLVLKDGTQWLIDVNLERELANRKRNSLPQAAGTPHSVETLETVPKLRLRADIEYHQLAEQILASQDWKAISATKGSSRDRKLGRLMNQALKSERGRNDVRCSIRSTDGLNSER